MRVVVQALLSLGLVAVVAAGCGGSNVKPSVDAAADTGGGPGLDAAGDVGSDAAVQPCQSDADCEARFPELGACQVAVCGVDGTCGTQNIKNYEECDDANACTSLSACVDGVCTGLADVDCDDDNACTTDSCAPATGCAHAPAAGTDCDDLDPCTGDDACDAAGVCVGGAYVCDPCTTDADCAGFEDGNQCNGTLRCEDGTCQLDAATVVACDTTGDPACAETRCVPATGACERVPLDDASACEDGNLCTQGDTCQAGACEAGDYVCDSCTTAEDCSAYAPENVCLGTIECHEGQCRIDPETVVRCEPSSDPCAVAYCDAADGQCKSRPAAEGAACSDGEACTVGDRCAAGECAGTPRDCDDGDPCTIGDSCDAATGQCVNTPLD